MWKHRWGTSIFWFCKLGSLKDHAFFLLINLWSCHISWKLYKDYHLKLLLMPFQVQRKHANVYFLFYVMHALMVISH
jgi:hypothetical protein